MSRGAALALAALPLCCVAVVVAAGFWGYSYDDAFITFRYAETWLEQCILRYNPS